MFLRYLLLIGLPISVCVALDDPVVIQAGDQVVTRREFEQRFEIAMVLTAIRVGAPNKSGVHIRDLRERYLEVQSSEILLLKQAVKSGITVSEAELNAEMTAVIAQIGETYGEGQAGQFSETAGLREYLRDQLILEKVRQMLMEQVSPRPQSRKEETDYLTDRLRELRGQTSVQVWPDRLD